MHGLSASLRFLPSQPARPSRPDIDSTFPSSVGNCFDFSNVVSTPGGDPLSLWSRPEPYGEHSLWASTAMGDQQQTTGAFSCQYCDRSFKRLEHQQRHERTHTKEAPYKCPCGKAFPRGDLLRRHEKSAHNVDTSRRKRARTSENDIDGPAASQLTGSIPPTNATPTHGMPNLDPGLSSSDVTSGATNSLLGVAGLPSGNVSFAPQPFQQINEAYQQHVPPDQAMYGGSFASLGVDPFELFDVNDTFLENVDLSSFFLNPEFSFDQNQFNQWHGNYPENTVPVAPPAKELKPSVQQADQNSISRFGSPLPSVRPEGKNASKQYRDISEHAQTNPCWKLSASQYETVRENLSTIADALPSDFVLPSRLSVSRYIEGCIKGVLEHIPIVHIQTWSATSCAPDLLLAMLAIGAQYRFEERSALPLFYAAKAAVTYQVLQMRKDRPPEERARAPSLRRGSSNTSPASFREHFISPKDQVNSPSQDAEHVRDLRLQTMAAILILMVQGSWGPAGQMLGDALAYQGLLSELAREEGLGPEDLEDDTSNTQDTSASWRKYIRQETRRRTIITSYNFINLQSMAYNFPPTMLTSEIQFCMPVSQSEWNAKTPQEWEQARKLSPIKPTSFAMAVRNLFQNSDSGTTTPQEPHSAIGNYSLMFAVLQSIFFLRESSKAMPVQSESSKLRQEDIEALSRALHNWQTAWENSPESSVDPHAANGPVAFNSTALLRLAWIRIHSDLGPCRDLASRNPNAIVEAFKSCPPLHRSPGLTPALLHAAHALSVPVRLGINFVAKTQTLGWSIQHALCNLECAVFLSKWFEDMESTAVHTPITTQEKGLISLIRSIVEETGFFKEDAFEPAVDDSGWQRLIRHLGTAIAALWAEIFSGTHVFELVGTIGTSLDIYAKLLENAHTPIWPMRQP